MGAHYNLATTYGVTLPSGAVANAADKNTTVDVSEIIGASGEITHAQPLKHAKVEVTVSGTGPAGLAGVTTGTVNSPATMTIISAEQGEANKGSATFSIKAAGHEAFDDVAGSGDGGEEPTIDTVEIVSVSYACVETVKRDVSVSDLMLLGSDGKPAFRGKSKLMGTFDIQGRGDLPSGIGLGTAGAALASFSGKVIAKGLKLSEKAGDWNGWGVSGNHYASAA